MEFWFIQITKILVQTRITIESSFYKLFMPKTVLRCIILLHTSFSLQLCLRSIHPVVSDLPPVLSTQLSHGVLF